MLNKIKMLCGVIVFTAFSSHASLISAGEVLLGEYEDELFGDNYYTVTNNTNTNITEFGVTTGALGDSGAYIDDFYYLFADDARVSYSEYYDDDFSFDYYLADAWSASFYDQNTWDEVFGASHGLFDTLYGNEEDISGVNWYFFDQVKFDELWIDADVSTFYIQAGETIGNEFSSPFMFGSELASNFAVFNSVDGVSLLDTGSANEPLTDVPEPTTIALFGLGFLALFMQRKRNV